jgi:hypothetical protein
MALKHYILGRGIPSTAERLISVLGIIQYSEEKY